MVEAVASLPRVEDQLFQRVDSLERKPIANVQLHEELVLLAKDRLKAVIDANSLGPETYDFLV